MDLGIGALLDKLIKRNEEKRRQPEKLEPVYGPDKSPSSMPWEIWEFDKQFFRALSRWTLDHPETTLDRVLETVCIAIDRGADFIALIPNQPFPARSLVIAVAQIFKLGVAISRATFEVQIFAKSIVNWVISVKSVFDSTTGGRFSRTAWRNLAKMRELIHEICKWVVKRLEDKRWLQIGRGLIIQKEISEFKERIANARQIFLDISLLNLSKGIDAIKQDLQELFQKQESIIMIELKKIRDCQANQLAYIVYEMESRKQAEVRRKFLTENLAPHTVENPTYIHQGKLPCDADTRVEILAEINEWTSNISSTSRNFLWLTGDPGCGKSAITASITRECRDKQTLWAQFFINRNNDNTTKPNFYFPSIARQLSDRSADVQHRIYDALVEKPSLMDGISTDQATKLFVDAIRIACSLDQGSPVVIVIDGLDETDRSRLKETATIFSQLFETLQEYPNAKVFISSRTEDDIRSPFARTMNNKHVKHIHLDTSDQSSINDVAAFLKRRVVRIVEDNDLKWDIWPGEERLKILTVQASGLFIWAVTAVKFLQEQVDTMGTECLDIVLDLLNAEGMGDLNALYSVILRVTHVKVTKWEYEKFRKIVGAIVVLREPLSLASLGGLLDLRNPTSNASVDIVKFVRRLRTVLVAGTDAITLHTVPRLHKSFFEFITSEHAGNYFRIDQENANADVGSRCLWHLGTISTNTADRIPLTVNRGSASFTTLWPPFRYSTLYWGAHLHQLTALGAVVVDDSFKLDEIQHLLRRSTNDRQLGPVNITINIGRQSLIETSVDGEIFRWNAADGTKFFQSSIVLLGHRERINTIAFSPDGTQIASGSVDGIVRLGNVTDGVIISVFHGHTGTVSTVAFSPDGTQLASGSSDGTVRLWSTITGESLHKPLTVGNGRIFSIAFSPNGEHLASSSSGKIHLWDPLTGLPRKWGLPDESADTKTHQHNIPSIAFSPDGTKIASASSSTINIWDLSTAQTITSHSSHSDRITCVAFAPDGSEVISSSLNNQIIIWNITNGKKAYITSAHTHKIAGVLSVAFSPDGKYIVSGGTDGIRLWSALDHSPIDIPLMPHIGHILSISFSPESECVVSASTLGAIVTQYLPKQLPSVLVDFHVRFTTFSPSGKQIALATKNNMLYLYEAGVYHPLKDGYPVKSSEPNSLSPAIQSLCFSSDGTHLTAVFENGALYLWNVVTRQLFTSLPQGSIIQAVVSASLIAPYQHLELNFADGSSQVWESNHGVFRPTNETLETHPRDDLFSDLASECLGSRSNVVLCPSLGMVCQYTHRPEGGLWGFVNNQIIIGSLDGSLTILPVTHTPHDQ